MVRFPEELRQVRCNRVDGMVELTIRLRPLQQIAIVGKARQAECANSPRQPGIDHVALGIAQYDPSLVVEQIRQKLELAVRERELHHWSALGCSRISCLKSHPIVRLPLTFSRRSPCGDGSSTLPREQPIERQHADDPVIARHNPVHQAISTGHIFIVHGLNFTVWHNEDI